MKRVIIIGASSPLGRSLCAEFQRQGWYVIALVRKISRAKLLAADQLVEARFAEQDALSGVMTGVTLVVSCLGIKHEADAVDHGHREADAPAIHGGHPVVDFDSGGDGDEHGGDAEDGVDEGALTHREKVVQPNGERQY